MLQIKCSASDTVKLSELTPFQGDLKKRTDKDVAELKESLTKDGLLMPFAVWKHKGKQYLLDGHGRLQALNELAADDQEIATTDWPAIVVTANSEEQARKTLLQITSSYGHITKDGAVKFCAKIPGYKAPSINKFVNKIERPRKEKLAPKTEALIKIYVPLDKEAEVRQILASVDYIKVAK